METVLVLVPEFIFAQHTLSLERVGYLFLLKFLEFFWQEVVSKRCP